MRNYWLQKDADPVVKGFGYPDHPDALLVEYCGYKFVEFWDLDLDCISGRRVDSWPIDNVDYIGTLWVRAEIAALEYWLDGLDPADDRRQEMQDDLAALLACAV